MKGRKVRQTEGWRRSDGGSWRESAQSDEFPRHREADEEGGQEIEAGNIVLLFADSGWKYLNSPAFSPDAPQLDDDDLEDTLWW